MDNENIEQILTEFEHKHHAALVSVWLTGNLLKKAFRKFFRGHIRSEAQFNILRILKYTNAPLTQNDISRLLLVDKSNVTGLIDALEKSDLLSRNRVEGDRRSYHITLTEKGQGAINEMDKMYSDKVEEVMSRLTNEEHEELLRLMKKVRTSLPDFD